MLGCYLTVYILMSSVTGTRHTGRISPPWVGRACRRSWSEGIGHEHTTGRSSAAEGTRGAESQTEASVTSVVVWSRGHEHVDARSDRALLDPAAPGARLSNAATLRRAALRRELTCVYQPIVHLVSGAVHGAEALVRWQHPALGALMPDTFVGDAEASGAVSVIGRFVLETACRDALRWPTGTRRPIDVWVNVSPVQLAAGSLAEDVARALRQSGLDPSRLVLELTETTTPLDLGSAAAQLGDLRAAGVRVALDDLGSGYSSLLRLVRLPVDIVKIERELVAGVCDDDHSAAVVRALAALATALDVVAVAEGIETASQSARLQELGCSLGQGFVFSRALPAPAFAAMIDAAG